ncbi:hypothetical protein, partial [Micromonospora sp. NPDC005113]
MVAFARGADDPGPAQQRQLRRDHPDTADTTTVSPARGVTASTDAQAVAPAPGVVAASSQPRPSGLAA